MIKIPKPNRYFNTSAENRELSLGRIRECKNNIQKIVMMNLNLMSLKVKCHRKNIMCMTLVQTLSAVQMIFIFASDQKREKKLDWTLDDAATETRSGRIVKPRRDPDYLYFQHRHCHAMSMSLLGRMSGLAAERFCSWNAKMQHHLQM